MQGRAGEIRGRIGSRFRIGGKRGILGAGHGVVASMMGTRTPPGGVSPVDGQSSGKDPKGPGSSQDSVLGDLLALLHCTKMALRPRLDHM